MRRNKILRQAERHLELLNEKIHRPLPDPATDIERLALIRPGWLAQGFELVEGFKLNAYEGHFAVIADEYDSGFVALFVCTYEEGVQVWPPLQKVFHVTRGQIRNGSYWQGIIIPVVNQLWQHTSPTDWTEYLQKQREHRARFR